MMRAAEIIWTIGTALVRIGAGIMILTVTVPILAILLVLLWAVISATVAAA